MVPRDRGQPWRSRLRGGTVDRGRRVDKLAERISQLLRGATVSQTRDAYEFVWEGERGIVVFVTSEAVEFRLPTVEWTWGYAGPEVCSRLWKRVKTESIESDEALTRLIEAAREKRAREFRPCHFCKGPTPPEHAHEIDGKYACHVCCENRLGIVH